jgi:phage repressor protein C with HTH and peptisase S24 domain
MFDTSNVGCATTLLDTPNMVRAADHSPDTDPQVYTALMRIKPGDLSRSGWATKAGIPRNIFNDIKRHGNPKRATLEKLLGAIGWSLDRFEAEAGLYPVQSEVRGAGAVGFLEMSDLVFGDKPLAPLPLYGAAIGGEMGDHEEHFQMTELDLSEVLDYLRRPASLADDSDSYALTIVGDSMWPRFKPGERVGVSPKAEIHIGDDVIVQLRGNGDDRIRRVLIKELVRRTATYIELKQYNPTSILRVERKQIAAMHKVKGHFL